MTIRKRVITTCAILVALSALIATVALYSINGMAGNIRTLSTDAMPGVRYALEIQLLVYEFRGNCWKHISSTDASAMAQIERSNQDVQQKLDEAFRAYDASITQPEDRELFVRLRPAFDRYVRAWQAVLPLSRASQNTEATAQYMSTADPAFQEVTQLLRAIGDWNVQYGDRASKAGLETAGWAQTWTTFLAIVAVFAGMVLAFYLVRKLTGVMHGITTSLAANASQVSSAASQIASSSQVMAQNASENAAALEETSASTHEMTAQIQQNAQTAAQLTATMAEAVPIVDRVNAALGSLTESISKLNTSSQKIATIVKVIDEIAFQTNILALNAAVEAARSGEAGMGFAVVADEVRNLAHRSAEAAKQTAGLIEESVNTVRESSTRLAELTEASRLNGEHAAHVKDLVDHVSTATQQQAQAIREIEQALPQLEQGTQHVAAAAEEGASAAEEVTAQSASLKDTAAQFTAVMGF